MFIYFSNIDVIITGHTHLTVSVVLCRIVLFVLCTHLLKIISRGRG